MTRSLPRLWAIRILPPGPHQLGSSYFTQAFGPRGGAHYDELADNCEGILSEAYLISDTELFREVSDLRRVHHIWVFDAGLN